MNRYVFLQTLLTATCSAAYVFSGKSFDLFCALFFAAFIPVYWNKRDKDKHVF